VYLIACAAGQAIDTRRHVPWRWFRSQGHAITSTANDAAVEATNQQNSILVTDSAGPYVCETSRLPHVLHTLLTGNGEVVSLNRRPRFAQRNVPGTHFYYSVIKPPGPYCGWKDYIKWKYIGEWRLLGCYATRRNIQEVTILHNHCRENLKSYENILALQGIEPETLRLVA
jgi:hypothetical protein